MFGGFVGFAYLCRLMKLTDNLNIRKNIALQVLAATFAACSGDSTDTPANGYNDGPTNPSGVTGEIRVNADVLRTMEGTRTTTFDSDAAIKTEGSFICWAYDAGETTVNGTSKVNGITATWNGSTAWEFAEKHYWPLTDALDFFAYMPTTPDAYITGPTYTTARQPQFTCDMTKTVDKEFIWALAIGQDREHQGASGVALTFKHPFARIYFQLSEASGTAVKINSITISGSSFYKTGTCTFDGTDSEWSNQGGASSLGTLAINTPSIVIPNNYGSNTITVNASWDEWNSFSTDLTSSALTLDWQAGYSYTYTLTVSKYALKVDTSKYTEQW